MFTRSLAARWMKGSQVAAGKPLAIYAPLRVTGQSRCDKEDNKPPDGNVLQTYFCGVWADGDKYEMTPATLANDEETRGLISAALKRLWSSMRPGKAFPLYFENKVYGITNIGHKHNVQHAEEELDVYRENVREGIGAAQMLFNRYKHELGSHDPCQASDASAEGYILAKWNQSYSQLTLPLRGDPVKDREWDKGVEKGSAQNFARRLCNELTTPNLFVTTIQKELSNMGIEMRLWDRGWIQGQRMYATMKVADSSSEPPRYVELIYRGAGSANTTVLITAPGITFDCGGLCLQPDRAMERPVGMAPAAVAAATIRGIAKLKAKVNVVCAIPLCENMISGKSLKVGDKVKVADRDVQIGRTDFEAHLLAADALEHAQRNFKPSLVLNLASFSEGADAFGDGAFSCFTNSNADWQTLRKAGRIAGDRPWRMPLFTCYDKRVYNDVNNTLVVPGSQSATACLGASFIQHFMHNEWFHLDIGGLAWLRPAPWSRRAPQGYLDPRFPTGRPTRTLIEFLLQKSTDYKSLCDGCDGPPE